MRFGLTILPEHRWSDAAPMWRRAEELGFDHAWTYDHLVWGGLPDSPWFGTIPTLTAAAMVTSTIRLGTFVTSPNYRHPVTFMRDLLALDDISGGRLVCGIGAGGDIDNAILGGEPLTPKERFDRLSEFTGLLDRLLTQDHVSHLGTHFSAVDARTRPGPVQRPRIPFVMAANGPRSLRLAVEYGAGWVTTGPKVEALDDWWAALTRLGGRLDEALAAAGRDSATLERHLNLDSSPQFALESVGAFEEMVGRADELGFTDVITHWPRPDGPYAGDVSVLESVASEAIPHLR
ncbi:MAG TPA: LLM class flavin-dependent oxidoreductase [Dermatophilaceae bacterium]|jgi:alkanesulfonate monooxygenase SsuD/methylene tetrahydromethanopterin reductase-like flavin-dependent oxidoreductase (luciferase family)|nr:LLM class flavin-dependent oxidoreductase [Dermatophilaceae bacterium]